MEKWKISLVPLPFPIEEGEDLLIEKYFFHFNRDTLDVINAYMSRKNINSELQTRIREYLNFIWNEEKTQNIEEEAKIINS